MRRDRVGYIVVSGLVIVLAGPTAGCEDEDQQQPQQSASTQPEGPSQPQFQRLKPATQASTLPMPPPDWKPSTEPILSTTEPTTPHSATRSAADRAAADQTAEALATMDDPVSAVRHFLELCGAKEVPELAPMRAMVVEPPPTDELAQTLDRIRKRLLLGTTWEIVNSQKRGHAAAVIYKTTYRGRSRGGKFTLYQGRDDRWRVIIGELTPSRYTPGEKEQMALVAAWSNERLTELNAALAASRPATTQSAAAPAASSQPAATTLLPPP